MKLQWSLTAFMQASSEHSVCFAVPEKEVKAVAEALQSRFRQALDAGRLSQVLSQIPLQANLLRWLAATLFN